MVRSFQQSQSLWMEVPLPNFPSLKEHLRADVCIVGAGIVGLTCAYTLLKQGLSVIILDQNLKEDMQSVRTTAHLSWVLDDRYFEIEKLFTSKESRCIAESHNQAINYIEEIILKEKIDCDFERVDGYLFAPNNEESKILDKEYNAVKKIGMLVNRLEKVPCSTTFEMGSCLHFPRQAQFHITKYLNGLMDVIVKYGGKIFDCTHVKQIEDGEPGIVTTSDEWTVKAKSVIVATCTPINDRFYIHTKQSAYRTYVIAATIPKGSIPSGLYWDTLDPYHYIRLQKDLLSEKFDWLILGGEDHKTGQETDTEKFYTNLERWARTRFPMMQEVHYRWSGQVYEPSDGVAFIGRNPHDKNIYIATGDSGNGMTHGTIAGLLIPDLILSNNNPWEGLYDPVRKNVTATSEFIEENFNTMMQYKDWLTPGEIESLADLSTGKGVILREGLKKLAVYKDEQGEVHVNSALCPHLGGCVRWNSCEKSWDCPCHGSRFDAKGKVLIGPSLSDLTSCRPPE